MNMKTKDFSVLIYGRGKKKKCGVMLMRTKAASNESVVNIRTSLLLHDT